jgi:hypothetical protein
MEKAGLLSSQEGDSPWGIVNTGQYPGQDRLAAVVGHYCLFQDVVDGYEIFICDMRALKLQRGIDNPITPLGIVGLVQAGRSE